MGNVNEIYVINIIPIYSGVIVIMVNPRIPELKDLVSIIVQSAQRTISYYIIELNLVHSGVTYLLENHNKLISTIIQEWND